MSDLGAFLILFAALLVLIAFIRFLSWLTEMKEAHGSLPRAALNGVQHFVTVKHYQDDDAPDPRIMSRQNAQTEQTNQTDEPDGRVSAGNPWIERLKVDRTRTALMEVLVYSGWTTTEIRVLLKGDNGMLGIEIEAARKRLGIADPSAYVTPVAGRPTAARFETDPEFPYQAPAR